MEKKEKEKKERMKNTERTIKGMDQLQNKDFFFYNFKILFQEEQKGKNPIQKSYNRTKQEIKNTNEM